MRSIYTILTFAKINTKRFFRDRLALFFTVAFPLMFLVVFGGIFGSNQGPSFTVALLNESESEAAAALIERWESGETLEIVPDVTDLNEATERMSRGELDGTIVLPESFGAMDEDGTTPRGTATIYFTGNNAQAADTLVATLEAQFKELNARYVEVELPFTVEAEALDIEGLSTFDYIFAGLLGFSIIGIGIFGPANVYPELKRLGILRRLHATPLRVWQYFIATAISQAVTGLFSMAILLAVAILFFDVSVKGSYLLLAAFLLLSIVTILGIGLAIGGWARNQAQAAPLSNVLVFPMLFLSGTFFPRYLMPEWLQAVTAYLPLTPVVDGIRLITIQGYALMEVMPQIALLASWAVIIYAVAFRVFRWE